jgi:hypothetical protein
MRDIITDKQRLQALKAAACFSETKLVDHYAIVLMIILAYT